MSRQFDRGAGGLNVSSTLGYDLPAPFPVIEFKNLRSAMAFLSYGYEHPEQRQWLPPRAQTMGMWLLLASLAMFFFGAIVAYAIIRGRPSSPPPGSVAFPKGLWVSTGLLLACSGTLHVALRSIRRENQQRFQGALIATGVLALGFLIAQAISLPQLLEGHVTAAGLKQTYGIYGIAWALIAVHAAHVMLGIIPLAVVTVRGLRGQYDHEAHLGVKHCVMYWHFLDVVWLAMFAVFIAAA
ncbi:MAG: cytochrome c oxidase subunit 3 [Pirellulales bacterium]|nr:cytochrome c oxidase subunit 3 [Pirellulales bacterium]